MVRASRQSNKAPLVKKGRPLENIEKEIAHTMVLVKKSAQETAERARRLGELLLEAREQLADEGNFLKWAHEKFGYSRQHVYTFENVANNWPEVQSIMETATTDLSVRMTVWAALRLLPPKTVGRRKGADRKITTSKRAADGSFKAPGHGAAHPMPRVNGDQSGYGDYRSIGTAHIADHALSFKWDGLPAGERDEDVFLSKGPDYLSLEIRIPDSE